MSHTQGHDRKFRHHQPWFGKHVQHESPSWSERRTERAEIEAALVDLEISAGDPEVLLHGAVLVTDRDMMRRNALGPKLWRDATPWGWWDQGEDAYEYYPDDSTWDEYTSGCMDDY